MGVAYYPELNPPIADFQPHLIVGGKQIARAMPLLETWAKELGVRDLMSYYSETNVEAFAHIGEPMPPDMQDDPITWSDPNEGLKTVRAYLERLRSLADTTINFQEGKGRDATVRVAALIGDLEALESVLLKGFENGCKFRLRIDI